METADTFLANIGAALAILFLVAVATEILIETLRGALSGVFRGVFDSPFFSRTTELKEALASVQDMLPEDKKDHLLMVARLEDAYQKAKTLSDAKAAAVKDLVDKASKAANALGAKKAIHEALSENVASIEVTERQRSVAIKVLAGGVGIVLCTYGGIDAFSNLALAEESWLLGPVLTGIAAAGGSSFWHDQIERVRQLRGTVAAASAVAAPTKT